MNSSEFFTAVELHACIPGDLKFQTENTEKLQWRRNIDNWGGGGGGGGIFIYS
jgi:hypothetical protein